MKKSISFGVFLIGFILSWGPRQACAQWIESGVPIAVLPGDQRDPIVIGDGSGGAIVAWLSFPGHYGDGQADIFAQRIDASGYVLWANNGIAVCDADTLQFATAIAPDGSHGAIIVWEDRRDADDNIYAQRISKDGDLRWLNNGIPICKAPAAQLGPCVAPDGLGGAIIAWKDERNGADDYYAQRVDSSGTSLWAADGIPICTVPVGNFAPLANPRIIPDGSGGAIVAWLDTRTHKYKLFAQKVDANGSLQWTSEGVGVSTMAADQEMQELVSDGTGGAIITWRRERPYTAKADIDAQRIDSVGTIRWGDTGIVICTGDWFCSFPALAPDCCGGAFIAWQDGRPGSNGTYVQRVDASGSILWQQNGVPPFHDVWAPQLVPDGSGGIVIVATGGLGSNEIYGQRVGPTGASLWTTNGILLQRVDGALQRYYIASDGSGGAIVPWTEQKAGGGGWNIFAKKINADGSIPVPTLLQNYAASMVSGGIAVTWVVSTEGEALSFTISRAEGVAAAFEELQSPEISREGALFTFIDKGCESGRGYRYRLTAVEGDRRWILFETGLIQMPALPLTLYQNYPNPFNPETRISYYLPEATKARLEIYDSSGRRISVLAKEYQSKGHHDIKWTAMSPQGKALASGVYYCRLSAGKNTFTIKMTLLR